MLHNAPTGVPWSIVPFPKATSAQQLAEQTNLCWRASGEVDGICNQPLRATLDIEEEVGPDFRIVVRNGFAAMQTSRWPVIQVLGGQVSGSSLPPLWRAIPASAMRAHTQLIGEYGTTAPGSSGGGPSQIDIGLSYVNWGNGREGCRVQAAYLNGWPHAGVLAEATAGATTIRVDDVTGFTGASAFVYDDAVTEVVQALAVTADHPVTIFSETTPVTVPVGPGTLTLAAPLQYAHGAGVVVSSLPQDVAWATALLAAAEVLDSGATSVTMQSMPGSQTTGGKGIDGLRGTAEKILKTFRRII